MAKKELIVVKNPKSPVKRRDCKIYTKNGN